MTNPLPTMFCPQSGKVIWPTHDKADAQLRSIWWHMAALGLFVALFWLVLFKAADSTDERTVRRIVTEIMGKRGLR